MEVDVKIKYKDGSVETRKYGPQEKYDKSHTRQFRMKLNTTTDADILEWLDSLDNKQGKIKELIRAEIARTPK